jgi:hypothetical protein
VADLALIHGKCLSHFSDTGEWREAIHSLGEGPEAGRTASTVLWRTLARHIYNSRNPTPLSIIFNSWTASGLVFHLVH